MLDVVFTKIFRVGSDIPHYAVTLLGAIIFWTFFLQITSNCVTCLLAREGLLRKMRFPRLVIPVAVCVTQLYTLMLNMIPVFLFAIIDTAAGSLSKTHHAFAPCVRKQLLGELIWQKASLPRRPEPRP